MKTNHITIRIDDDLRESLETISQNSGRKISEIIRDEISFIKADKQFIAFNGNQVNTADLKLFQNILFSELISFLYRKKDILEVEEDESFILELIELTDKLIDNPVPDQYFKEEILHVKEDLIKFIEGTDQNFKYDFPNQFDYECLWQFTCVIRYDSDNIKII